MAFNNDASFNSDSGVGINDVRANENHDAAYWESYKVSCIILRTTSWLSVFLVSVRKPHVTSLAIYTLTS